MKSREVLTKKIEFLLEVKINAIKDKKYEYADKIWEEIQVYLSLLHCIA